MIRIDEKAFDANVQRFRNRMLALVRATRQRAKNEVKRSSIKMRSRARKAAPKNTKTLADAIEETYQDDGLTGIVTSGAPYARWVEGQVVGTAFGASLSLGRRPGRWPPPDPIRAWVVLRGLYLKWKMPLESAVFLVRRKIGKKGTPAQPHIKPAFAQTAPEFEAAMAKVFDGAAKEVAKAL